MGRTLGLSCKSCKQNFDTSTMHRLEAGVWMCQECFFAQMLTELDRTRLGFIKWLVSTGRLAGEAQ